MSIIVIFLCQFVHFDNFDIKNIVENLKNSINYVSFLN